MKDNVFVNKTKEGLDVLGLENQLAFNGFDIDDTKKENVILVMGLNPAGHSDDSNEETKNKIYFYSLKECPNKYTKSRWLYNPYFRPILDFGDSIYNGDVKWPWCNISIDKLNSEIENSELSYIKNIILKDYENRKDANHTIYIGDMFYFHETSSKKLPYKNIDYSKYSKEMLILHINKLKECNKNIDFIYINNAKVSHWLSNEKDVSHEVIEGINVFYGPMLSGQHAIDSFSKKRLIDEIKAVIK